MNHWSLRTRIVVSFSAVMLVLVAAAILAVVQFNAIEVPVAQARDKRVPGIYLIAEIQALSGENYAATVEYLLTTDAESRTMLANKIQSINDRVKRFVEDLEKTNLTGKQQTDDYIDSYRRWLQFQKQILTSETTFGGMRGNLDTNFVDVSKKAQILADYKRDNTVRGMTEVIEMVGSSRILLILAIAAGLVVAGVAAVLLTQAITRPMKQVVDLANVMSTGDFTRRLNFQREDEFGRLATSFNQMADQLGVLVGQVQKSGIQVNASCTEIAATAKQQQATASEIAATTTEIGATSKEITATSKELLRTVLEVASVAEATGDLAGNGQSGLSRMEETMKSVMLASGSIGEKLATLSEKATNITHVVTTITKVADQTNLLSLNAAIEAEKAGEFGRGFSVVANEIRRLADQTALATEDIESMVKEMQSAVSAGVMGMDKFSEEVRRGVEEVQLVGGQLTQIIQQVQTLTPRFEAVSEGMEAQSTGAQQITDALIQLSDAAKETAESLKQSSRVIDQLSEAATGLRSGVSRFKL